MSESWECPKCQTLNVSSTHCYSCGEARPNAPDMQTDSAQLAGFSVIPEPIPDWQPTAAIEPSASAEVDLEPHPCWCHLVRGDHDIRDHPATSAADDESTADRKADARLDQLEIGLARSTSDWTVGQVGRTYDSGADGEQDYEDEMLILEEHGYTKSVERNHGRIDATFTSEAARVGPVD